jgi:uncharacterized protein GlcG (DUF336 family)
MPSTRTILVVGGVLVLGITAALSVAQPPGHRPVHKAPDPPPGVMLSESDVALVVQKTAESLDLPMVIAVTNRQGNILAIYEKAGAPTNSLGNFYNDSSVPPHTDSREVAVALARTTSFFSNDQAPLSSRTVRYISGIHFPPGVVYTPNAALYGIENTNRGCPFNADYAKGQAYPPAMNIDGTGPGYGILTGKADLADSDGNAVNPGGVPLFMNGIMVGGVGVAVAENIPLNVAEYAAVAGSIGAGLFVHTPLPFPGEVVINGVALPFVNQTTMPAGYTTGVADGSFSLGPIASPEPDPYGDLVVPRAGTMLTQADVQGIITAAVNEAMLTRAVIRLPLGSYAHMVMAVSDLDGTLLAVHRMFDATIFSIDVAVAKSRNAIFFSGPRRLASDLPGVPMNTAVTNRTIGFGAQPLYPPGVPTPPSGGPFFQLYKFDTENPCTQGSDQLYKDHQSGIVFFPGSLALFKNGVMVGGLGVSGDGVDQDDFVTVAGGANFPAPLNIRADQIIDQGVRLPYSKFPQNPTIF